MRYPALRAANGVTDWESGAFVADSCCRSRAMRVKAFANKGLASCS
jgi:hypothetical protein